VVIEVEGDKHGESKPWCVGANGDQMPSINKLAGFRKAKDMMHPYYQQLYMEGLMQNDKSKQAEFIIQYSKDLFWVLQSFVTSRIKPFQAKITAKYGTDKGKIECMDDPFSVTD
jgi:hypothetical protein